MDYLIINQKEYKKYKDTFYYVSKDGDIYSTYSKKFLKQNINCAKNKKYKYIDVYNKELKRQQHTRVHRIVYETWVRSLEKGEQVNHINDDGLDNRVENLYVGNQKENVRDCFNNNHRVGYMFYLTLFDKEANKIITFCPAKNFIKYSGHPCSNGNVNKFFNKNWFKKRYEIIRFKRISNLKEYQNVTTIGDECNLVE